MKKTRLFCYHIFGYTRTERRKTKRGERKVTIKALSAGLDTIPAVRKKCVLVTYPHEANIRGGVKPFTSSLNICPG